jgi:hypothetical protein
MPLQTPVWPQVAASWAMQRSWGSGLPAATGLHWPTLPTSLQLTQAPVQTMLQQTPSLHWPDRHWLASSQVAPSALRPHWPLVQGTPAHCSSLAHREWQRSVAASQPNGAQVMIAAALQLPALHTLASTTAAPSA